MAFDNTVINLTKHWEKNGEEGWFGHIEVAGQKKEDVKIFPAKGKDYFYLAIKEKQGEPRGAILANVFQNEYQGTYSLKTPYGLEYDDFKVPFAGEIAETGLCKMTVDTWTMENRAEGRDFFAGYDS